MSNAGLYIICFFVVMIFAAFTERHDIASIAWFYGLVLFGLVKLASNHGIWIVLVLLVAGFILAELNNNRLYREEERQKADRRKQKEADYFRQFK